MGLRSRAAGGPPPAPHPMARVERAHVRDAFVRILGGVFVVAFWSLGRQVLVLYGARGLLPGCGVVAEATATLFRFGCNDQALWWGTVAGAGFGVLLALGWLPRLALVACWVLYL